MKFDYYILNSYVPDKDGPAPVLYRHWLEQAKVADDAGYEIFWCTEHHFRTFGGMLPNPQLFLSALSSITTRVRLGTAVSTLPLHHPIRVAEDFAMLDNLSGGRIECGFGRGMTPLEYGVFDKDWDIAQEVLEEAVGRLERVWSGSGVRTVSSDSDGAETLPVLPPVGSPLRIWMTANRSPEHFEWIGRHGYNLMTLPWAFPSMDVGRDLIAVYRKALADAGHDGTEHEILGMMPAFVAESAERAHEIANVGWSRWRELTLAEHPERPDPEYLSYPRLVAESRAIFGDPKECADHVARVKEELGLSRMALVQHFGGIAHDDVLASMRLFMEKVAHH